MLTKKERAVLVVELERIARWAPVGVVAMALLLGWIIGVWSTAAFR